MTQMIVEVGFSKFTACNATHQPWQVCDGCKPDMGVLHVSVDEETPTEALLAAVATFQGLRWARVGYVAISAIAGVTSPEFFPRLPAPRRAPPKTSRSPLSPTGSTASTKRSAQKQGGTGQRKQ